MGVLFTVLAISLGTGCVILTDHKGIEWAGGILAFPSACFYAYTAVKLAVLGAPTILVSGMGILMLSIPLSLYRSVYKGLLLIESSVKAVSSPDNREHVMRRAEEIGSRLLETEERKKILETGEQSFRLFDIRSEKKEKMIQNQEIRLPESRDNRNNFQSALEEANRMIQKARALRQEKEMLARQEKMKAPESFPYQDMMKKADQLCEKKNYNLAIQLYRNCSIKAATEEEKRLAWLKENRCLEKQKRDEN